MDPETYAALFKNVNPYTSDFSSLLFGTGGRGGWLRDLYGAATTTSPWTTQGAGLFGTGANYLGAAGAGIQGLLPQILAASQSYDPNASFSQFMALAPQLQGLAMGSTGGMDELLKKQTEDMVRAAIGVSSSEFSGLGAGYSSANIDAGMNAAARAGRDAALQLGNTQLGIYNTLLGTAMPLTAQNQQFKTNSLLSGLGLGLEGFGALGGLGGQFGALGSGLGQLGLGQQGLYASLFGSALGAAGGLSSPEWVAPPIDPGSTGLKDMSIVDIIAALASLGG
jgi:hypothetical protein